MLASANSPLAKLLLARLHASALNNYPGLPRQSIPVLRMDLPTAMHALSGYSVKV